MKEGSFRCFVMGSESLLIQCSEILLAGGHALLGVVSGNEDIARWAREREIRVIEPGNGLAERIGDERFEWLFSIANLSVIPERVLAKPTRGAINFHDGPLPRYAGLHATSWAILNGERTHGVTWHRIEGGIDEGPILEQQVFPLEERETALTLNTRCYEIGIECFARLVSALDRGAERALSQDLSQRTYFGRHARPPAACAIDWHEPAHRIDALVRALAYGRYRNPLGLPKAVLERGALLLPEVERASETVLAAPGTVLAFDEGGLEVAIGTGSLRFRGVLDADGQPLTSGAALALGIERGAHIGLSRERLDRLTAIDADLAKHEVFWAQRLVGLEPARIADLDRSLGDPAASQRAASEQAEEGERAGAAEGRGEDVRIERRILEPTADPARLLAGLAAWLTRVSGRARFDVGHHHPGIDERIAGAEPLYSSLVPLRLDIHRDQSFETLRRAASAELERVAERGTYLRELHLRQPGARRPEWDLVFERVTSIDDYRPPAAIAAALVTDGARAALIFDAMRLSIRAAESLVRELEVLLRGAAEAPETRVAELPLVSAEERRRVIEEWNATAAPYPAERCVHELFEAQARATPDAIALVCRDRSLTYAELDRAANRLAHHLVSLGVSAGTPVGLCTDRSHDLVIGALGILKAGGAYVPLDPAYPADRLAFMVEDSRAPLIVTQGKQREKLPATRAKLVALDEDAAIISGRPDEAPSTDVTSAHLAYLIYTSGSTGKPKGVMVEHRNVASFFAGMDAKIDHDPPGVWLAVTSLSFDISVLELFWTLARGFTVVLFRDEDRAMASGGGSALRTGSRRKIDFSLFYFASDEGERAADKYRLLLEGARFADEHGFSAVWTPERHFHAFGGLYPNPSVVSAALAVITNNVKLRAGSCVSPLHHPIRVAEEWALVDNLSRGRVGISFAAGWQPNDFVLRPDAFENNKQRMVDDIELIRRLWRGETMKFEGPKGPVSLRTLPRPVQAELPFWITAAGNPDTFALAGKLGGGILTHLLGQSLDEVRQKVEIYRAAWRDAGHPGEGHVVLMLHTFVGTDESSVKETVREPMKGYLQSSMMLIQAHAWSFPAFKRLAREDRSFADNFMSLSPEDTQALLDHAFERYYESSGLFGTPESCVETVERCRAIGVDEIGCLIDFGIDSSTVLEHLTHLDRLRARLSAPAAPAGDDEHSIAAELARHRVTHLQCTPSMARMLLMNAEARAALAGLGHLLVGGEALPGTLARELRDATRARITNMYGPTETTIWSSTQEVEPCEGTVAIGRPIANTSLYVLDESRQPVPVGIPGELYIGGEGVARGYWDRPELTSERFLPDPFSPRAGARMYRTGDEVRWTDDARVEFLGRIDHQVKIRGYRIELGEIEALLAAHPSVREAVVIAREDAPGDKRLVAYVVPRAESLEVTALKTHLLGAVPDFMVPSHVVIMESFPLTPNKKIDRRALPRPETRFERAPEAQIAPAGDMEEKVAAIWKRILGLAEVSSNDSFFDLGGHSLLAVQAHREIREATGRELTVTDIFRFPTIAGLAAHLEGGDAGAEATLRGSAHRGAARRQAAAGGQRRVLRRR